MCNGKATVDLHRIAYLAYNFRDIIIYYACSLSNKYEGIKKRDILKKLKVFIPLFLLSAFISYSIKLLIFFSYKIL